MARFHPKPDWHLPESRAADRQTYLNRRSFLKAMGVSTLGASGLSALPSPARALTRWIFGEDVQYQPHETAPEWPDSILHRFPADRNPAFTTQRPVTGRRTTLTYNNFYEFGTSKTDIWTSVEAFRARPWTVSVTGAVETPRTFDVEDLLRSMPLEERVYRLRCVEAWSIVVPWTGFPFSELARRVKPLSSARYVRFVSFMQPDQAPGQQEGFFRSYPWPYTEGLRMDEAMHDLTLLAVGVYGQPLPKQNGAPLRLVVPWKYGFKSIKSIVRIEFLREKPATFWNTIAPEEYGFYANVNPNVPHPRWSQKTERDVETGERFPTQLFNGYQAQVASMYPETKGA